MSFRLKLQRFRLNSAKYAAALALLPVALAAQQSSTPAFPAPLDGAIPRPVAQRTGADHVTWDLGPDPQRPGQHRFAVAVRPVPAAPSASLNPNGDYGGWQCNTGGASGTGGSSYLNNAIRVGELTPGPATCNGYIRWNLGGVLSAFATPTGVALSPLHTFAKTGTAILSVHVVDANNTPALPFPDATYDVAVWNDFNSMYGGHPEYANFNINLADPITVDYTIELSSQAVMDAADRLKGGSYGYFAMAFNANAVAPGNFVTLDAGASQLLVYYSDFVPSQIAINHLQVDFTPYLQKAVVELYDYDSGMDLTGWTLRSTGWSGTESFTLPPLTWIPRHGKLLIIDRSGTNTSDQIYTGGNVFHWWQSGGPYNVQLSLHRPVAAGGTAVDYVCWGGAAPVPPAGAAWSGPCLGGQPAGDTLLRQRDGDSDSAGDWTIAPYDITATRMPGQTGTRRRSDVFLNEILVNGPVAGSRNWLEIANYGPPADLQGWSVQIYSQQPQAGPADGTYTFPANPVGSGAVVWLAEGTYFGGVGPPVDNLHRNLGFAVNWNQAPFSGEIILRDAGGHVRDAAVFGQPRNLHLPAEIVWNGPFIDLGTGATADVARAGDLSSNSAGDWVQLPDPTNWGLLSPTQQGAGRVQDEVGGDAYYYNRSASTTTAFGAGSAITLTRQVGLEEFALKAAPVSGPTSGLLVVKQQGAGSLIYSKAVTVNEVGQTTIRTGLITPPLVLNPGTYAFMLYLNGNWYDNELYFQTEWASFGTAAGAVFEDGFTPSASFTSPDPAWSVHTWLSTISPPANTLGANPPDGEETVPYSFAHTSGGGYGASRAWSVTAGFLPAGLALAPDGVLSGTPVQDGIYTFTVRVTDGAGLFSERAETLTIAPRLEVATSVLTAYDRATAPYLFQLQPYGGVAPFSWICTGVIPCNATGKLSGTTAVVSGDYPISVQVTDAAGLTASRILTLTVYNAPAILTNSLANGYVGIDYGTQRLSGAGGSGAGSWALTGGALPPGLTLSGNAITGTPTIANTYNLTLTYTVGAESAEKAFTILIGKATVPPYWIRRGLAGGDIGTLYFSPNYALDGTVIAISGDRQALYIARDGGFFWKPMSLTLEPAYYDNALHDTHVNDVAYATGFDGRPAGTNHTIAVATDLAGLLVSDDLDNSWTARNTGLSYDPYPGYFFNVTSVKFDPSSAAAFCVAYNTAAAKAILFKSAAGVDNWIPLGNTGLGASGLDRVYISPNFAVDRTFFAPVGGAALFRTLDNGGHWQTVGGTLLVSDNPESFEISPSYATDHTVALTLQAATGPIYLSNDNGASFIARGSIFNVKDFHFPPNYNAASPASRRIYASGTTPGGEQMMVSYDNGFTFSPTGTGGLPPPNFSGSFFISPGFATDGTLFTLGRNGVGIARSEDGGSLWGPSDNGIYFQNINAAAYAPDFTTSGKNFVGTDNGVYYSVNRGKIWQPATYNAPLPATLRIKSIAVSPAFATDNKVFAYGCGLVSCQVIGSSDGGRTFSALAGTASEISNPGQFQISPAFASDSRLFYTGFNGALSINSFFLSSNAGASFTAQNTATVRGAGSFGVSPNYATDPSVYLNDYVFASKTYVNRISTNGGTTFNTFAAPTGNFGAVFAPNYNRTLPLSGTNHTFFWNCQKTVNSGTSFTPLPPEACGDIWISPTYQFDATLFVFHIDYTGLTTGLYKSIDGGASFSRLLAYGTYKAFSSTNHVALSPNFGTDRTLMVATGYGLYVSTDGGASFTLSTGTEGISKQVTAVAQDPNIPGRLYIGTGDVGVVRSNDDGLTATDITGSLPAGYAINGLIAVGNPTVLLAAMPTGVYRFTEAAGNWTLVSVSPNNGSYQGFTLGDAAIYASRIDGASISSPLGVANSQLGVDWTALDASLGDSRALDFNGTMSLTLGKNGVVKGLRPSLVTTNAASLWSASSSSGARYSTNSGTTWVAAPGADDYALPNVPGWQAVKALGINAASASREVLIGHNNLGLYKTPDGGLTWRNVSGPGSGLESTSKNVSTLLSVVNQFLATDVLVGINGTTTGGVYLSGDAGEHWAQINQGFDPSSLNIATLAKTSCSGCPVQYYSGTYGSGVYTRTIVVTAAPTITGWCFGVGCNAASTCVATAPTGPGSGGQPFKLCGTGFLALATVEFDGVPASGCSVSSAIVITCAATPVHFALQPAGSAVAIRLRNTDTRTGYASQAYLYGTGSSRVSDLLLGKSVSGADAVLQWSCIGCGTTPARVYRSQTAAFSLFETYNGGTGSSWINTGALSGGNATYFWMVE